MFSRGSLRGWALGGLAVLILAVVGWVYWQKSPAARPEAAGGVRVGAVAFANLTGDPDLDWAGAALPAAVVRQAQGLEQTRAFYAHHASQAWALGANYLLEGYLTKDDTGVLVHYVLSTGAGERVARGAVLEGAAPDPSAAVSLAGILQKSLRSNGALNPLDVRSADALREMGWALVSPAIADKLARWRAAVEAEPQCGWCWEELAEITARSGGREAALALLDERAARAPGLNEASEARLALMRANLTGDAAARLKALETLAALMPGDSGLLAPLADALVNAQRGAEAVEIYRRACQNDPARADLWNSLGYALAWLGRFDEAIEALSRYERAAPGSANPRDSIGEVLMMAGRFNEAAEAFLDSHQMDPAFNGGAALEKAALVRWLDGDAQEAGVLLEKYLKQRAEARDALTGVRRARWQYLLGRTNEAVANLKQIATNPVSPAAAMAAASLSLYAAQGGRWDEAASLAALARQQARDALGLFAANVATRITAPPGDPTAVEEPVWEAMRLTFRGELTGAEQHWQTALAGANPAQAGLAREMLAQVQLARGETSEAATTVAAGWPVLMPDQALLFDFLIYPNLLCVRGAAVEQSKPDMARRYYEQFLRSASTRPDPLGFVQRARAAVRL